jgi:hypothetical protein
MQMFFYWFLLLLNHDFLICAAICWSAEAAFRMLMHVLMQVHVQSDPAGRLIVTGEPEQLDNPWGVTPFKKVC